ncbi:MAG TPA: hypothetical protein VE261_06885 [Gaiellaceae bacterium]|nr:hypothetical protein [Gaiellaceae bacterium]
MTDLELIVAGAVAGIATWMLYRFLTRDPLPIDPSTGGVLLPAGVTYGPPAPITGGLS